MDTMQGGAAPQGGASGEEQMKKEVLGFVGKVEAWLDEYMVRKAPFQLPMNIKEILVKIAPYLVILMVVLTIPAILAFFGLSVMLAPLAAMSGHMNWGFFGIVTLVTSIGALIFQVMAISGLFKRTHHAWRLLFYASLLSFVGGVLSYNPVSGIIASIIGWYILFQVKELYKN